MERNEVGKNTAFFLEAGVKNPLYMALCPNPPAREKRKKRRKDERQKRKKKIREIKETIRQ